MLFHLFCMFDDYWRINCRSQNSAGKRTVKIPYFWRSVIRGKHPEVSILSDAGGSQKGRLRWATRGPHPPRRGWTPGRAWVGCGHPGPPLAAPFRVYHLPENLRREESSQKSSAAAAGRKTPERKELSGRQKSAGEIPSRRGEIIAIVTIIELDFIGIIITITSITSTIITTISTSSRCNILGWILSSS